MKPAVRIRRIAFLTHGPIGASTALRQRLPVQHRLFALNPHATAAALIKSHEPLIVFARRALVIEESEPGRQSA